MVTQVPLISMLAAVSSHRGATYEVLLLAHVVASVVGFGTVGVAGVYAVILGQKGPVPESVARYYRPGVNWVGRTLYLVPILGFVLVGMSHGPDGYSYRDGWITAGLILWAAAALAAEMVLWPAERRLARLVASGAWDGANHRSLRLRTAWMSGALMAVFVVAMVVMVAKPG